MNGSTAAGEIDLPADVRVDEDALYAFRVRTVLSSLSPMVLANTLNVVIVVVVLYGHVDMSAVLAWSGALAVTIAARAILLVRPPAEDADAAAVRAWSRLFSAATVASGCVWGLAGWVFVVPHLPSSQLITAVIIAGLVAGAFSTLRTLPYLFTAYTVCSVMPLAVRFLFLQDLASVMLAWAFTLFTILMSLQAFKLSRQLTVSEARRLANLALVEHLRAAKINAEAANRAKSRFLSGMSHELRTPLNAIIGFGQLLESDPKHALRESQQVAVRHILRGGAHLLDLIDQVLDLAKIESGTLALSLEPVDPQPVIADCLVIADAMADRKDIAVHADLPEPGALPFVRADRTRLRQVLLNLLSNAAKYNDPGGSVTLACTQKREAGRLRFTVTDTGHGIPAEHHGDVFTPFNRLAAEGSETEGTGIGLSITRQFVELMGGTIGFSSAEGEGSAFWFELPVAEAEAETDTPPRDHKTPKVRGAAALPALPPCTVLYVEDNPANLQLMEMVLGRVGDLTLHSAHTAEIGIDTAKAVHPDLILMDINLPGMDGLEALRILRDIPATRDIPVIAVSANAMPHDIRTAEAAGFDGYVTKPFNIPDVMATIARELGRKAASADPDDSQGDVPPDTATPDSVTPEPGAYPPLRADDVARLIASARALPAQYLDVLDNQAAALPRLIADLHQALAAADLTGAEAKAHTLKTNAGTFGARHLWSLAQQAEQASRAGNKDTLAPLLPKMQAEYEAIAPVIAKLREELKGEG